MSHVARYLIFTAGVDLMSTFQCNCNSRDIVSYPDPNVRNDDYRLQYNITYRGSGQQVVLVRRNVGAPIRIESSRDVTIIRFQ